MQNVGYKYFLNIFWCANTNRFLSQISDCMFSPSGVKFIWPGSIYGCTETRKGHSFERREYWIQGFLPLRLIHHPSIGINTNTHRLHAAVKVVHFHDAVKDMDSHLLAPAAMADSDWQLPFGHHRLSIAGALFKQTVYQQRLGGPCRTPLVSTSFPLLRWLLGKKLWLLLEACLLDCEPSVWNNTVFTMLGTKQCCPGCLSASYTVEEPVYYYCSICGLEHLNEAYIWLYYISSVIYCRCK